MPHTVGTLSFGIKDDVVFVALGGGLPGVQHGVGTLKQASSRF